MSSIASLAGVVDELSAILSGLDADSLSAGEAAAAVTVFVRGENLCATGKALCAERAARAGVHRRSGHNDPASWLAERSGETRGRARDALDTAAALSRLNELDGAVRSGELSTTRARVVAEAALLDPRSEPGLVGLARSASLGELRDEAEAVKAAARSQLEDERRYEEVRRARHLRTYTGRDGGLKGQFSLTPDAGAKVLAVLQPASDFFFEEARREGRREHNDAYMADALVAVVTGEWPGTDEGEAESESVADEGEAPDGRAEASGPGAAVCGRLQPPGECPADGGDSRLQPPGECPADGGDSRLQHPGECPADGEPLSTCGGTHSQHVEPNGMLAGSRDTNDGSEYACPAGARGSGPGLGQLRVVGHDSNQRDARGGPPPSPPSAPDHAQAARRRRRRQAGGPQPPRATVICRVDLSALRRGSLAPGESCEIPGVGPVPLAVARELFSDCFLKFVISDGIDVRTVAHFGRSIPAHLKTALQFRDRCCVVPGCGRTFGLEYDHIVEFALGGPTSLENLCRLCGPHHAQKTHKGYRISGGPGGWQWLPPRAGDSA